MSRLNKRNRQAKHDEVDEMIQAVNYWIGGSKEFLRRTRHDLLQMEFGVNPECGHMKRNAAVTEHLYPRSTS